MNPVYLLRDAVDTPETGKSYPAVQSYDSYDFKAYNSMHTLKAWKFPEHTPDIRFKLKPGAKLTDLLTQAAISSSTGLLLSKKFKELIEKFVMAEHKFYPALIEAYGSFHEYYWLHLVWPEGVSYVDYSATKFNVVRFSKIIEPIEIRSYDDLKEKGIALGRSLMIYAKEIVMRLPEFDVFPKPINGGVIIAEKVKRQIELSNLTGVLIKSDSGVLVVS
jgi:hypothetical protein